MGSRLSRFKECGGSKCTVRGFWLGFHVIDTLNWVVREARGWFRNERGGLAQPSQIKDEWAPYACMKSRMCLTADDGPDGDAESNRDRDGDESIAESRRLPRCCKLPCWPLYVVCSPAVM